VDAVQVPGGGNRSWRVGARSFTGPRTAILASSLTASDLPAFEDFSCVRGSAKKIILCADHIGTGPGSHRPPPLRMDMVATLLARFGAASKYRGTQQPDGASGGI
jgi:hypothetical protein